MKNILIDNNIVLDYFSNTRRKKYPESEKCFKYLLNSDFGYISSSSLDNIAYIKMKYLKDEGKNKKEIKENIKNLIQFLIKNFKIAKTPSYIEIDYEDIEDSQLIASAKAIDALVLTRDEKILKKYPDITISPKQLLVTMESNNGVTVSSDSERRENINNKLSLKTVTNIDFANLKKQHFNYYSEIEEAVDRVYNHGRFIMGPEINELEENLCKFSGAKNAVTCSSGTDALLLAMMALDIKRGDEVITTPFTFIATAETIALLGAKPVFVDIDEKTYNIDVTKIEEKITPKTKAIIAVSLYGQPCDLDKLKTITDNYQLSLIIDGAQSFGATYKGKAEVHYCDIYTTSFFPAKPLGCYGDGGAVLTNNDELAEKIRMLRIHGQSKRYHHKFIGLGARLDTIQAAILNVKLKHYKEDLTKRQEVANKYNEFFKKVTVDSDRRLVLPTISLDRTSAWAQYSIRVKGEGRRDKIQAKLKKAGIPTAIHYPMSLHLQECFRYLGYKEGDFRVAEIVSKEIMSLPMNPYLSDEEIEYIINKVVEFVK